MTAQPTTEDVAPATALGMIGGLPSMSLYPWLCPHLTPKPSMREISTQVAESHGVQLLAMRGVSRSRRNVLARHEAMWRIYQTGRFSNRQIGIFFGGRDHTTVIASRQAHQRRTGAVAI